MRQTIEQRGADLQLTYLSVKCACHHPLTQPLEAVHLGLDGLVVQGPVFGFIAGLGGAASDVCQIYQIPERVVQQRRRHE